MKKSYIYPRLAIVALAVLSTAQSYAGLRFDTLRRQATKDLESIIPAVQEAVVAMRSYRENNGVFMSDAEIDVEDMGIINRMANDLSTGAITIHLKTSSSSDPINPILSNKYIRIFKNKSAAMPGMSLYSFDDPDCVTNITMNGHHGSSSDSNMELSQVLKHVKYFKDLGCVYRLDNGPGSLYSYNTLPD